MLIPAPLICTCLSREPLRLFDVEGFKMQECIGGVTPPPGIPNFLRGLWDMNRRPPHNIPPPPPREDMHAACDSLLGILLLVFVCVGGVAIGAFVWTLTN